MDIKNVAKNSILAIALNGNTISEVLNQFEVNFPSVFNFVVTKTESSHSIISISESLSRTRHIHDLKRMNDFLTASFEVAGLDIPKRNFKLSLANWITKVLLSAYEMLKASKVKAAEALTPQPELQPSQPDVLEADALEAERKQAYAQYIASWQEADALEAKLTAKRKESKELGEKLEEIKAKIESKRLEKVRTTRPPDVTVKLYFDANYVCLGGSADDWGMSDYSGDYVYSNYAQLAYGFNPIGKTELNLLVACRNYILIPKPVERS